MASYVIGEILIKDEEKWAEYLGKVGETLEPWGATVMFRGTKQDQLAGEKSHTHVVVIEFPDRDSVNAWYRSPAYKALIPLRQAAADVVLTSYDG